MINVIIAIIHGGNNHKGNAETIPFSKMGVVMIYAINEQGIRLNMRNVGLFIFVSRSIVQIITGSTNPMGWMKISQDEIVQIGNDLVLGNKRVGAMLDIKIKNVIIVEVV